MAEVKREHRAVVADYMHAGYEPGSLVAQWVEHGTAEGCWETEDSLCKIAVAAEARGYARCQADVVAFARECGRMEERVAIVDWMHDARWLSDCNPVNIAKYIEAGEHRKKAP